MKIVEIAALLLIASGIAAYFVNAIMGTSIPARELLAAGLGLIGGYAGGYLRGRYHARGD